MILLIVMLLVIGTVLCMFEFLVPGFGVPGITGGICLVLSVIFSTIYFEQSFEVVLIFEAGFIIVSALLSYFVLKVTGIVDKIVLRENLKEDSKKIANYDILNKEGVTKTQLRPVGKIVIENNVYEVISDDGFIEIGNNVIVKKVEVDKIIVGKA